MPEANSPLRYPGGKAVLSDFLGLVIAANVSGDCTYAEPYAGGAGAAINLLLEGKVGRIILNDADRNIWAFWKSILDHTDEFIELIAEASLTVDEWLRQRKIYETPKGRGVLERGFAAFFLNRCNRSGIITNGGVIGGLNQEGRWKIDARFNREELIRRIERISAYREVIEIYNFDALTFLRRYVLSVSDRSRYFVYCDPPYFVKGSGLYLNYYKPSDHAKLARVVNRIKGLKWLVTYDNAPEIRLLYRNCRIIDFNLRYSAHTSKEGSEIIICDKALELPVDKIIARAI